MSIINKLFLEEVQIASGFVPINLATGANAGDWINMKEYAGCAVVFFKAAGTAGDDPTVTLLQALTNGGSSKALDFTTVFKKQGAALNAIGTFTEVTQALGNTFTHADLAEEQAIIVIDIKADMLDIANGYDWFQASVGDVGTNAQLGCMLYLPYGPRHAAKPLPTAIA
jgi:hypothetical protein